ncbi:MAG: hypothetical protein IK122_01755 [Alphaproteobacteria bacterium]|nr:hypothetical protein [Alphaproteobacteria bacterium]
MKKSTKQELKDLLGDILVAILVMSIFIPLSRSCTDSINRAPKQKTGKAQPIENPHNIWYKPTQKTR